MFGRLVRKELLAYLLDHRFIAVFALCALLTALSVYAGSWNYVQRLQEYHTVSESNRRAFQETVLDKGRIVDLLWTGYRWNRPPEVLSTVVYGLSGTQGREALLRYQLPPFTESSIFAGDLAHAVFRVLDIAFIVKVVLSLAVLLFTHDAICGEKERGTFRLYASFSVPRSTLALSKLVGSIVAVLVPFVLVFLLASTVLALFPEIELRKSDWMRMVALLGSFALYLSVFVAFGLLTSALTHRRSVAFLWSLMLWTVWLFVVPNLAADAAQRLVPAHSFYDLQRLRTALRWEIKEKRQKAFGDYYRSHPVKDWNALSEAQLQEIRDASYKINTWWDTEFFSRLGALQAERRNQMRLQQRLAMALSAVSPVSVVSYISMDLARTSYVQQDRMEDALNAYTTSLNGYVRDKQRQTSAYEKGADLTDFPWFIYQRDEALRECLSRNAIHFVNLALLAILGFSGAYVVILQYDVR